MARLILVRHAEPHEDARGRCYGSLDVGLSRRGEEQAAGLRLSGFEAVYTSPRLRAVATARALDPTPIVEDDLRELDFGDFEGRTYEEIERDEPELFRQWMEAPTTVRFPNGESYADLKARASRVLEEIRARHACAVVVTHGGVIRAGLAEWLSLPDDAIFRLDQSYCGITIVDWLDGVPIVRLLNGEA